VQDLQGKVAVVTGAGSGIGLALASRLSAEGMRVALADVNEAALAKTEAQLVAAGAAPDTVLTQTCDVRLEAEVVALADHVFATWGQVDVLCNNAGVFVGGLTWERPTEDLDFVFGVNVWGMLHGIRAFVPRMLVQDTEGHIVNTCSVAGLLASPFTGPYVASKFAALAVTEGLALDLAITGSKLKVTALCPGMVQTNLAAQSLETRPAELAVPLSDDAAFTNDMLSQYISEGIEPDAVAGLVIDAIRAEQFLVLTHPHHADVIRARTEQLVAGQLPEPGDFR
jgi:NAD(P)-dependent dehydrogenase (short-subunit alcohol dehydrogenase family)